MNQSPKRRILFVDDEESIYYALRRSLSREGYQVLFACGPEQGLAMLQRQQVDMVISDQMMPNMSGLEFLELVRARFPNSLRLMLTGHADLQTVIDAINHGAIYRFLTKPWDETELKVTLFLAFEQLDLERENRRLLAMVRRQYDTLKQLEHIDANIGRVVRDSEGFIHLDEGGPESLAIASASAITNQ
jgi:two-component system, probable response regulator PhcQ